MNVVDFLSHLKKVKKVKNGWQACCPAHDDKTPSLSITTAEDKILINCRAGCSSEDVVAKIGLQMSDLFYSPSKKPKQVAEYKYTDENGKHLYSVIRFDPKDFRQKSADGRWTTKGIRQVLYRLPKITEAIKAKSTIYIVEGEKDVHSLESIGLTATTSSGGAGKNKWKPGFAKYFYGASEIIILPDNDGAGEKHANAIKSILPKAKIILLPDLPEKGDVSDWIAAGGTAEKLKSLHADKSEDVENVIRCPFRCLGYNRGFYYYFPSGSRQVTELKAGSHTKGNLLILAPLDYWSARYSNDRGLISWDRAADDTMRDCESAEVFDLSRHRGRGAWYDSGIPVIHLGDKIIVDGIEVKEKIDGEYIYEAGIKLKYDMVDPLPKEEAFKLQEIADSLFWEKPIYSKLMAGWCVIAPICGAMIHRPNIWLTGKSGDGKSFIVNNIIKPCLGNFVLYVQSTTTEPGIRQALKCDALPVMIDEFEGEDMAAQERVQKILDLARQSFSDSDGKIIKGSSSGTATEYQIRSTFFMTSIGVGLVRHADETRTTVLTLKTPHDTIDQTKDEHFKKLKGIVAETMRPEWCNGLRSRTFKMIKTIRENAEIFSIALAKKIGSRRAGDQAGALLAGAYSLCSDSVITEKFAMDWIEEKDWRDQEKIVLKSDEIECLNIILQHIVRLSPDSELSVYELIKICKKDGWPDSANVTRLRRMGIRILDDYVFVSSSLGPLRRIMEKTPYAKNWGRILRRIDGAIDKQSMRFVGNPTVAVGIPWKEVDGYPGDWDDVL